MIAINPKMLDELKILSEDPAKAAIIAPTIITDEIALVTDISGVCKAVSYTHLTLPTILLV